MSPATQERIRLLSAEYHELVLAIVRAERALEQLGHPDEAKRLSAYMNQISQLGAQHAARIGAQNGHGKDSQPPAAMPVDDNGHAPSDETGAIWTTEVVTVPPPAVVVPDVSPTIDAYRIEAMVNLSIDQRCEQRLLAVRAVLKGPHNTSRAQQLEVTEKMLLRARTMLESGTDDKGRALPRERKEELASRLLAGAETVLRGGEVSDV